jgi:hypothetical protein
MFTLLFRLGKPLRLYTRCVYLTQSWQMYDIVLTVLHCLRVQRADGENVDAHELLDKSRRFFQSLSSVGMEYTKLFLHRNPVKAPCHNGVPTEASGRTLSA